MARLGRPLGRWAACGGAWKEEARGNLRPRALLSRACPLPPRVARPPAAWHRACTTPRPAEAQQGPSRVPGLALRRAARAREAISEHTAARQIISATRHTQGCTRPAAARARLCYEQQHAQRPTARTEAWAGREGGGRRRMAGAGVAEICPTRARASSHPLPSSSRPRAAAVCRHCGA